MTSSVFEVSWLVPEGPSSASARSPLLFSDFKGSLLLADLLPEASVSARSVAELGGSLMFVAESGLLPLSFFGSRSLLIVFGESLSSSTTIFLLSFVPFLESEVLISFLSSLS